MHGARRWPPPVCMYEEEDTYMHEEEDTCMVRVVGHHLCVCMRRRIHTSSFKEEEDTCVSFENEEEDICMSHEPVCLVGSFSGKIKKVLKITYSLKPQRKPFQEVAQSCTGLGWPRFS